MPHINLLPVKAARKRDSAKNELFAVIGLIAATMLGLYFWNSSISGDVEELERKLRQVKTEIAGLKQDVGKVQDFRKKEKKIQDKLKAIGTLLSNKTGPAIMMDALANILTNDSKRVWFTSMETGKGRLKLEGGAMEHEDISDFQIAMTRNPIFKNVQLLSVKSVSQDNARFLKWVLVCGTNYAAGKG